MREVRRHVRGAGQNPIAWAGLELNPESVVHTSIIGSPGSAKTLLLRQLLRSAITHEDGWPRRRVLSKRAVVYDPKREMMQVLAGIGANEQSVCLNPFDQRALSWSIAVDFNTPSLAKQLSHILLVEKAGTSDPFWLDSSRVLLEELIRVLQTTAGQGWTFNDLLELTTGNPAHFLHALAHTSRGRNAVRRYLWVEKQAAGLFSSLDKYMRPFSAAAPAMARTAHGFSISDWLAGPEPSVVVLGTDPGNSSVLEAFNRAFITRLGQLLLDSDTEEPPEKEHVWLFLDEYPQLMEGGADSLPIMGQLSRAGRSKGVHIAFTAQSAESLRAALGAEEAGDLFGISANIAFTSAGSPGTRRLVEQLVGTAQVQGGGQQVRTDPGVVDSMFNHMQQPSRSLGIPVLAKGSDTGFWQGIVPPGFVRKHLAPKDEAVMGYERRGPEWSEPLELLELDYVRLGLKWPPPDTLEAAMGNMDADQANRDDDGREEGGAAPFMPL